MSKTTKIEWTDRTWNPVTGCTPISPGCAHCYARRMAKRLAGRCGYPAAPHEFDVTLHPEKLADPLRWRDPARVFVCSMSDLFHPDVPFEFVDKVFAVAALASAHTFQMLTKRPGRALEYFTRARSLTWEETGAARESIGIALRDIAIGDLPGTGYFIGSNWASEARGMLDVEWPLPNVWKGVTVENQEQANARIPLLLQTPAAVQYVSIEPMLGPINLVRASAFWSDMNGDIYPEYQYGEVVNWVICGGETGPGARPFDLDWARSLRDQCADAGVPFFYKGAGTAQYSKDDPQYRRLDGELYEQFPEV